MMSLSDDEKETEEAAYTYEELSGYTKAELLVIADENGITGLSMSNLKDEIINAILGAE